MLLHARDVLIISLLSCPVFAELGNQTAIEQQINTGLQESLEGNDMSLPRLENVLNALTNLTEMQKTAIQKQDMRERELKEKNRADEERELARAAALKKDHKLLKEIRGRVSRKIKFLVKHANNNDIRGNAQDYHMRPRDCADHYLERGEDTSGIYRVFPTWTDNEKGFLVYCDMETDGGGWTVIHRWSNVGKSVLNNYFKRTWNVYRRGFGDLNNDFWLGNDHIYDLTNQGEYEIRFDSQIGDNQSFTGYKSFWIDEMAENFRMHVSGGPTGDTTQADDVFHASDNQPFSTSDRYNVILRTEMVRKNQYIYGQSEHEPVSKPKCTSEPALRPAWWYPEDCSLNNRILLSTYTFIIKDWKKEFKIRPVVFAKMKDNS